MKTSDVLERMADRPKKIVDEYHGPLMEWGYYTPKDAPTKEARELALEAND